MFKDQARTIFCVAAGCLLAYWINERIEELRAEADRWESGIRREEFEKGYIAGIEEQQRTAEWNAEHANDPMTEPEPATVLSNALG